MFFLGKKPARTTLHDQIREAPLGLLINIDCQGFIQQSFVLFLVLLGNAHCFGKDHIRCRLQSFGKLERASKVLASASEGTFVQSTLTHLVADEEYVHGALVVGLVKLEGTFDQRFYNGQIGKGILLAALQVVSVILCVFLVGFVTTPLLWIYGIYDAYKIAGKLNQGAAAA